LERILVLQIDADIPDRNGTHISVAGRAERMIAARATPLHLDRRMKYAKVPTVEERTEAIMLHANTSLTRRRLSLGVN
jgi:hypothetical protein